MIHFRVCVLLKLIVCTHCALSEPEHKVGPDFRRVVGAMDNENSRARAVFTVRGLGVVLLQGH